jgi:hypothetical protein
MISRRLKNLASLVWNGSRGGRAHKKPAGERKPNHSFLLLLFFFFLSRRITQSAVPTPAHTYAQRRWFVHAIREPEPRPDLSTNPRAGAEPTRSFSRTRWPPRPAGVRREPRGKYRGHGAESSCARGTRGAETREDHQPTAPPCHPRLHCMHARGRPGEAREKNLPPSCATCTGRAIPTPAPSGRVHGMCLQQTECKASFSMVSERCFWSSPRILSAGGPSCSSCRNSAALCYPTRSARSQRRRRPPTREGTVLPTTEAFFYIVIINRALQMAALFLMPKYTPSGLHYFSV